MKGCFLLQNNNFYRIDTPTEKIYLFVRDVKFYDIFVCDAIIIRIDGRIYLGEEVESKQLPTSLTFDKMEFTPITKEDFKAEWEEALELKELQNKYVNKKFGYKLETVEHKMPF